MSISLGVPAVRGPESGTCSGLGLVGVPRGSGMGLEWCFGWGVDESA